MIKLIATIDSTRGLHGDWNLPSAASYETKRLAASSTEPLRRAFDQKKDVESFFHLHPDIWVLGGSELYEQTLPYAEQLFITQVNGIFNCSSYFPHFEDKFILTKKSRIIKEYDTEFQYQLWVKKILANLKDLRDSDTRNI